MKRAGFVEMSLKIRELTRPAFGNLSVIFKFATICHSLLLTLSSVFLI